jgi:K+-transporting ATPase KdpF subunit
VIISVFGWAIAGDDLVGIVIATLISAYLVYALIRPEKV